MLTAAAPFLHFGGDWRFAMLQLLVGSAVALISAGELLIPRHQQQEPHAFWHFWDDKQ